MATPKKLGNFSGNDIELCRTTNQRAENHTVQALVDAQIPFTRSTEKIPFFQRMKYNGASEMLIIMTNPHRYVQARQVIDEIDSIYRRRLVLTNY